MMKNLTIALLTLIIIGGCGYADKQECELKEIQECKGVEGYQCQNLATEFCSNQFPEKEKKLSKEEKERKKERKEELGKALQSYHQERRECKEGDGQIFNGRCEVLFTTYKECLESKKSISSCKNLWKPEKALFCMGKENKQDYIYLLWTLHAERREDAEIYFKGRESVEYGYMTSTNNYYRFVFEHPLNPYVLDRKDLNIRLSDDNNYSCSITTVERSTNAIKKEITEILNKHDQLNQI